MYPRFLLDALTKRMGFFPVIMLVGPRQSGKTTLTKKIGQEKGMTYATFDDLNALIGVQMDPIGYLNQLSKPLILDEVQRAPEIMLPIKVDVDNNRDPGRYILTGSANPLLVPKLGDALTGRMTLCNLWPLSQGEILRVKEKFMEYLFSDELLPAEFPPFDQEELIIKLFQGGFPALHAASSDEERRVWCNDYLSLSLQKDINELSKIEGLAHLPALMYGLAARVGSTLNVEELSRIAKTASTSIRRYIQLLENLFLLYRLSSWSKNIDKHLTKAPKIHFSDTALLLHILNFNHNQLRSNLNILGHVVENFIVMECVKQASWSRHNPKLYHFRQEKEKGTEVDLVIESEGKVVGIEIKLSSVVRQDDTNGLNALRANAGHLFHKGIILYMGHRVLPLGQNMLAMPISALWCGIANAKKKS
jgi:uncharacterized protein